MISSQSLLSSSAGAVVLTGEGSVSSSNAAKLATLNADSNSSPANVGASSLVSALLRISSISH
jgi:hypothetical protein